MGGRYLIDFEERNTVLSRGGKSYLEAETRSLFQVRDSFAVQRHSIVHCSLGNHDSLLPSRV